MKQRIRVAGIIRRGDEVLLMKRMMGRSDEPVFWELPTGKIAFGEQPEEAMARTVLEYLGVQVTSMRLKDAVTFVALEGSSQLDNLYIVYEVEIPKEMNVRPAERYSAYKYLRTDNLSGIRLNDASLSVIEMEEGKTRGEKEIYRELAHGATVYVDGASKGNPGPAGVGYYIVGEDGQEIDRGGDFIGFATSRLAEYQALKEGVLKAKELGLKSVRFVSDNLMMVNQMNGVYKVKNRDIWPVYRDIQEMLAEFEACAFVHQNRELNREADAEANEAIRRHFDQSVI